MLKWNEFDRSHKIFVWLTAIFMVSLVIANLIGSMLFSFRLPLFALKDPVLLSAGIIPFPVTFILTDLINEFYGKQGARFVTWVGFGMCLLTFVYLSIGNMLPVDSISQISKPVFRVVSDQYTGMFVASLTAYLIGQMLDIQVFHLFRGITKHRFIWLRATGSTVISQLFDSLIVTFLAFHVPLVQLHWPEHGFPALSFFPGADSWMDWLLRYELPLADLWRLATGNYTWKFIIAVGITPLLYLGHMLLRRLMPRQEQSLEAANPAYQ